MNEITITCSCDLVNKFNLKNTDITKPFFLQFICPKCEKEYKMELMLPITKNIKS
jgi:hypothetical protein